MAEGARPGLVSLVGAGPGDPGLLTVRGRRAIERADVVLYDRLASPALLASVHVPGQERIHVGKTAQAGLSQQSRINELLVRRALGGARVVRLKGGDPMIFGRGGEELEACVAAGVPFELVPGVSSVSAAPALAGIPLTHREVVSGFTVVTGHERAEAPESRVAWAELARTGGTLVVLMGVLQCEHWASELQAGGLPGDTPVAFVRWATLPRQQVLTTTLAEAPAALAAATFRPPAVALVGGVVDYRASLAWVEARPLHGQVIGVTRSAARDLTTFEPLEDLGAAVVHVPLTRQEPVDEGAELTAALGRGGHSDLVLTSRNGVEALARGLEAAGLDVRSLAGVTTWAVGPATAAAMRSLLALGADRVPEAATGAALVALAREVGVEGRRFLFPAAEGARDTVPDGLRALGAEVEQVSSYRTVADPLAAARLDSAFEEGLSLLAIASPSAVDALAAALALIGRRPEDIPLAAIGTTTAAHATALGFDVAVLAQTHTMAGLARAIVERAEPG